MQRYLLAAVYFLYLIAASITSYLVFRKDKLLAKQNKGVRIPEKTLMLLTVLGGAIGSFSGRKHFHHKTNKIYFTITIYVSLLLQVGVGALMLVVAL